MRAHLARIDPVLVQAVIAAALSFAHLHDIANAAGQHGWKAWAYPVSVDLLLVAAWRRLRSGTGKPAAWCWFVISLTASLGANVATAGLLTVHPVPAWLGSSSPDGRPWPSSAELCSHTAVSRSLRRLLQNRPPTSRTPRPTPLSRTVRPCPYPPNPRSRRPCRARPQGRRRPPRPHRQRHRHPDPARPPRRTRTPRRSHRRPAVKRLTTEAERMPSACVGDAPPHSQPASARRKRTSQ